MDRVVLSGGRIVYAVLAGASLLVVSLNPTFTSTVGEYTLQAGLASAAAGILPFGVDRVAARRRAAGEIKYDIPSALWKLRAIQVAMITVVAAVAWGAGWNPWAVTACAIFVATRLIYADLEALWIASARSIRALGVVVAVNGGVTATSLIFAAPYGAAWMVIGSSLGNAVALLVLLLTGEWEVGHERLEGLWVEAAGFGLSAAFAVVYARVDLLIIAVLGFDLRAVAVYGVITRIFDALGLIRGSISQIESRHLAPVAPAVRFARVLRLSVRVEYVAVPTSVLGIVISAFALRLPLFDAWGSDTFFFFVAAAAVPAYFLHLSTSAMVFADRRSHILLSGSILAAVAATVVKLGLIVWLGIGGAVVALGVAEAMSFAIFLFAYRVNREARDLHFALLGASALSMVPLIVAMVGS